MDRQSDRPAADPAAPADGHGRGETRDSLMLTAKLKIGDALVDARIRNLSAGGLMAEYPGMVSLGQAVEIDVRGIGPVAGRIAWATDGRIGVAFDQPVDPKLARKPVGPSKSDDAAKGWLHVYPAATPPRFKR